MTDLVNTTGGMPETMTSIQMAELVDKRHDNVKRTIETLADQGVIARPQIEDVPEKSGNGRTYTTQVYKVGERDSYVIVAQLSPEFTARLVDFWQQHRGQQQIAVPTTAEAFAHAFTMIADAQKQQAAQQRAIDHLREQVSRVEVAQTVLRSRPANAEAITHVRSRIGRMFGLSANIIDEVMRQSPYAPKPAGMVRNDHVDADGSLYAVYWQKDVTKTFERFVDECVSVTPFMFTHPFIEGRFRVARKAVVA